MSHLKEDATDDDAFMSDLMVSDPKVCRLIAKDDGCQDEFVMDDGGRKESFKTENASCPAAPSPCMEEFQPYDDVLDGCRYRCLRCGGGTFFRSLAAAAAHIKRRHGGDPEALEWLKKGREDRWTECKMCGEKIIHDRMELGSHVWTVHGIPLDAYTL